MKEYSLIMLLSCVSTAPAQEGNRIYSNHGYYNQQRRNLTNNGICTAMDTATQ